MKFINFPQVDFKVEGMENIKIPKMMKIKQLYDSSKIENLKSWILKEMRNNLSNKNQYKGKRLCITVGSRGIPHLDLMIKTVIDELKLWGAEPFIIPSMGSHGGATAEGQKEMIAGLNITEESMGVPILSSMEVVQIGELDDGTPVYCDKYAYESDGIVVINKVKPHTSFRGKYESGMVKMMSIGLAKHKGASMFHMKGFQSFPERIPQVYDVFLKNVPIAFGMGFVQNAYDEISDLEVMEKELILERDAELLEIAKKKIANFKMPQIDVLIIDEVGKNISGTGFDPNVVGRSNEKGFEDVLDLKKLFIRGLTKETHHSAAGLGAADITTLRCVNDVDFQATWINAVTATTIDFARLPMYAKNDRDALLIAIRTCIGIDFDKVKVVRIKNTLEMEYIEVSENFYDELKDRDDVEFLSEPYEIKFDKDGYMI